MRKRILVYGYGNPGRQDDGLGPALIERLEKDMIPGVVTDSNYQLQIEDAVAVSQSDTVIFVDATVSGEEHYAFNALEPSNEITFTTHAVHPGSIVALCDELYHKMVKAYILSIRGYGWELGEAMTPEAKFNLEEAYRFLKETIYELMRKDDMREAQQSRTTHQNGCSTNK